jgi:hypothetical protein
VGRSGYAFGGDGHPLAVDLAPPPAALLELVLPQARALTDMVVRINVAGFTRLAARFPVSGCNSCQPARCYNPSGHV